ncbi:hypothetical protein DFJ69_5488 [Thermomonospora umbrina]|uniref:Uncharacterized protein n=1 Tax=Thermomonospora umbrina TaxID=111806 RepID=A0A3D9SVI2_9ACTN|nr:hypothetical protein DFJ69_5488 [Thermomonospora umbrina]
MRRPEPRRTHGLPRPDGGLLLGLALVFCVLGMHGLQASASPVDRIAPPFPAVIAGHTTGDPATTRHSQQHGTDEPAEPHQDHPGGEVCLAMLVIVGLAALLPVMRRVRTLVTVRARTRTTTGGSAGGRSPPAPTLFRLVVLRL